MPAWEDLSEFFDTDEFAVTVNFVRANGTALPPVIGNFDDPAEMCETGEFMAQIRQARFTCPSSAVAVLKRGDTATVATVRYILDHDPVPDGTGLSVVLMSKDFTPPVVIER
jgi:hypothetical protein